MFDRSIHSNRSQLDWIGANYTACSTCWEKGSGPLTHVSSSSSLSLSLIVSSQGTSTLQLEVSAPVCTNDCEAAYPPRDFTLS